MNHLFTLQWKLTHPLFVLVAVGNENIVFEIIGHIYLPLFDIPTLD